VFKHILVSLDGSDCSKKALLVSIGLAQAMESQISLVSVAEPLSKMPTTMNEVEEEKEAQEGYFHKIQQEAKEKVKSSGLTLNNATILVKRNVWSPSGASAVRKSSAVLP